MAPSVRGILASGRLQVIKKGPRPRTAPLMTIAIGLVASVHANVSAVAQSMLSAMAPNTGPNLSAPPAYQSLRFNEDWSRLVDPGRRDDYADPLKYIPLGSSPNYYLSLGGDARLRGFAFNGPANWGQDARRNEVYLWQRYLLHGDLHLGPAVRVFGELEHSEVTGRRDAPVPGAGERDRLDVNQLFIDLRAPLGRNTFTLRIGRQEVAFGSEYLVSPDEGAPNRVSFEGVRGTVELGNGWQMDALALRPVDRGLEVFDDRANRSQSLAGIYAAGSLGLLLPNAGLDLYWLRNTDREREFDQGVGHERRHTLGARFWGDPGRWDWNAAALAQVGQFGRSRIQAFGATSDVGYRFEDAPLKPRFGLRLSWFSGDRDPAKGALQTFSPLYPRGDYFSDSTSVGGGNLIAVNPSVSLAINGRTMALVAASAFWRASVRDGTYNGSGQLVASGRNSRQRFVGATLNLIAEHQINQHVLIQGIYEYFQAGPSLEAARRGRTDNAIHRLALLVKHRF